MKGQSTWSYTPYRPPLTEVGEVYICRVVPYEESIRFEWLPMGAESYSVFCRVRGVGDFFHVADTSLCEYTVTGLAPETEYDISVNGNASGSMKTNLGGKLSLSVELDAGKAVNVSVAKK